MDIDKAKAQLQQLDDLAAAGVLGATAHQAARQALEQALLGELLGQTGATPRRIGLSPRWLWGLAGAGLLGAASLAYALATLDSGPLNSDSSPSRTQAPASALATAHAAAASAPHALGDQQMLAMVQSLPNASSSSPTTPPAGACWHAPTPRSAAMQRPCRPM